MVAVAMPPIRFPAAKPRWPDSAAEIVIANSGRLPAMASSTIPPIASPIPRRRSSSSVDFESSTPATQVAPDAATNTRITRNIETDATFELSPMRSAGPLMRHRSQRWHASVMPSCPQPSLALRCGTTARVKSLKNPASAWVRPDSTTPTFFSQPVLGGRPGASGHQYGPSRRTLELARSETRSQRWMVPVLPWPRRRRRCADAHAGGGPETRERTIGTIPARRFHHCCFSTKSSAGLGL